MVVAVSPKYTLPVQDAKALNDTLLSMQVSQIKGATYKRCIAIEAGLKL